MATYFVASGGSNTSPYDTWAKAATSLQTALTAASGGTDTVVIQYNAVPSGDAEVGADTTYTTANHVRIISASNDGGSAYTPTAMGTANWIGNSTASWAITLAGGADDKVYVYGLTLRNAGSTTKSLSFNNSANGCDMTLDNCYLWLGTTGASSSIITTGTLQYTTLTNCTFRFGATSHTLQPSGSCIFNGCSVSASGSTPSSLIIAGSSAFVTFSGCDFSLVTGNLVGNTQSPAGLTFQQCKLGSGVIPLSAQTSNPTKASGHVFIYDCASDSTHYNFGYYNGLGSVSVDAAIYANDGAEYQTSGTGGTSWKIVSTANATHAHPFVTPWISVHHEGTSAITPYLECLRDGSATAYQNDEIWSEWMYKGTDNSTLGVIDVSDKMALNGSAADQTTGSLNASGWTGENATAWFGKLAPTSTITPYEIGDLCARVCVGEPSITVYVDPTIRGRS